MLIDLPNNNEWQRRFNLNERIERKNRLNQNITWDWLAQIFRDIQYLKYDENLQVVRIMLKSSGSG